MNKKNIFMLVTMLFSFYGQEDKEQKIKNYCLILKDINLQTLEIAFRRCVENYKYLPTVAEIFTELKEIKSQACGDEVKSWDEAWMEIQKAMAQVGPYKIPKWSTPEIKQVVDTIGWVNICSTENKDEPILRAQVRDMYNAINNRAKSLMQTKNIIAKKTGFESIGETMQQIGVAK